MIFLKSLKINMLGSLFSKKSLEESNILNKEVNTFVLSFKFNTYILKINSNIIQDIGELNLFCMKAIEQGLSIKDISSIILIDTKVIEKQLNFALSRQYLNKDNTLSEKGRKILLLFEFIEKVNNEQVKICLEKYIEKNKKIFKTDNSNLEKYHFGEVVKDNFYDYKVKNIFKEIDDNQFKIILINYFKKYENIIEEFFKELIFDIEESEDIKYFNYIINDKGLMNNLVNPKYKEKSLDYINLAIPILKIDRKFKSLVNNDTKNIVSIFDKYKYFSLIDGNTYHQDITLIDIDINYKFQNKKSIEDILKKDFTENFNINDLLFLNIETKFEEFEDKKSLNITNIMEQICEQ